MSPEVFVRVLVVGGIGERDAGWIEGELMSIGPSCVLHTAHPGATSIAGNWARAHGIQEVIYMTHWGDNNKAWIGLISKILDAGDPDLVLNFGGSWADKLCHSAIVRRIPVRTMGRPAVSA